ncbi:hypothetical protein COCCADRAFT_108570 [Bipolaris zeicola 26-R-13]|uniref:Uncharacterized protein n=1 Tax=Cochliobolus carbonum (strain 26-R-13) TaxID=930089 RepID=W6XTL3_COCC2|nr:uncharacterized protein COCCADRAFT_108570 [Bipolaris zeicola 26-R-13]EUC28660.1 hypothetical protein COCCADRAFT_108570 [Bipolaris zeicola 26-R-13]
MRYSQNASHACVRKPLAPLRKVDGPRQSRQFCLHALYRTRLEASQTPRPCFSTDSVSATIIGAPSQRAASPLIIWLAIAFYRVKHTHVSHHHHLHHHSLSTTCSHCHALVPSTLHRITLLVQPLHF